MKAFTTPLSIKDGALSSTTDYDEVVRCQVIDALTTNHGERVMYPEWGCNIQSMLFNPSDELVRTDTAAYIKDRLAQFVPRAFVRSVSIQVSPNERNLVFITVEFKASQYGRDLELTLQQTVNSEGS